MSRLSPKASFGGGWSSLILGVSLLFFTVGCGGGAVRLVIEGDGRGRVVHSGGACGDPCSPVGELVAVPDAHSRFEGWSGGCTGLGSCRPVTEGTDRRHP